MSDKRYLWNAIVVALSTIGIAGAATDAERPQDPGDTIEEAVAVLHPTEGSDVRGIVTFRQVESGIAIGANVEGLAAGDHGFHIHELGNCSAPDGTSAGGHFNPEGTRHGGPMDDERHAGDLGNLTAGASGRADYERSDSHIAFDGAHSIIGRAVIVHAGADDLSSQPTGAAGGRLACGVIGIARVGGSM